MCGITGYINLNNKPLRSSQTIREMLRVQKHRGPDDSGIRAFSLKNSTSLELTVNEAVQIDGDYEAVLGFNRLSILDLSMNGHQPMASPDEKVLLTLNGEIYNAFDYKKELTNWGYRFKSTTDTEIVLALYLKYGFQGMINRLNGMFAIAIVDLREGKLYIARDRFGIKPMYYISNSEILAFSSELKSFNYLDNFRFQLEEKQLNEYLIFRNNLEGTLFKGIHSLEPGHYLTFTHSAGLSKHRYFDVNQYTRETVNDMNFESLEKQLGNGLGKSVKSQLMSDVKLGCQLSGGIDSSLVTWFAKQNSNKGQFESVSIVFDDPRYSEEKYIDRVAEQLKINAHKFQLESSYYLQHIEKATWHFEAPINHPNTIGIYLLSQRAKEHVTVLLSGEGADEVFGGYSRFYDVNYPFLNRRLLSEIKNSKANPLKIIKYFNAKHRAIMATAYMQPGIALQLYHDIDLQDAMHSRKLLFESLKGSLFDRQVKYEMQTYLPDLLIRQDKMSMAHSIENRVPFLDNEVVENSFNIPEKYLLQPKSPEGMNTEKYLLKKLTALIFGNDFAFRDKMGFGIPLKQFFADRRFNEYLLDDILPGIRERGIFNSIKINQWLSDMSAITYHELEALWIAITFEIWAKTYLDQNNENWDTPN
ncbi:MAG: asparagine synthase (glutamine-hydrolyzing) [Bacteroidales bacterium]|nr:asparagine synthase (glutamine-hydrolyzing) [Bacteroidales bacterium]